MKLNKKGMEIWYIIAIILALMIFAFSLMWTYKTTGQFGGILDLIFKGLS